MTAVKSFIGYFLTYDNCPSDVCQGNFCSGDNLLTLEKCFQFNMNDSLLVALFIPAILQPWSNCKQLLAGQRVFNMNSRNITKTHNILSARPKAV